MFKRAAAFFSPLTDLLQPLSARSWVLLLAGPMFAYLTYPYISVSAGLMLVLSLPLMLATVISIVQDWRRRPVAWAAPVVLAWIVLMAIVSLVTFPKTQLHDELLLTEVSLQGLTEGVNPYSRSFVGTRFDTWAFHAQRVSYLNGFHPAATTYVYLPGHLLLGLPIYVFTHTFFDWYDQRMVYIFALTALLIVVWRALARSPKREALILLFALSPFAAVLYYHGSNEMLMILALAVTGWLLVRGRTYAAALALGVAVAVKQLSWVAALFLIPLLLIRTARARQSRMVALVLVAVPLLVTVLPFALWSPRDLAADTLGFFAKGVTYPASGEGVGGLLVRAGLIRADEPFPFWVFQLTFVAPLLLFLYVRWRQTPSVSRSLQAGALAIGAVGFFWRYFLPAHLGTVVIILALSYVMVAVEQSRATR